MQTPLYVSPAAPSSCTLRFPREYFVVNRVLLTRVAQIEKVLKDAMENVYFFIKWKAAYR